MKSYKNAEDEPSWGLSVLTDAELGSAFNWYNSHLEKKDIYDIIMENGDFTSKQKKDLKRTEKCWFKCTHAAMLRMKVRGARFTDKDIRYIRECKDELLTHVPEKSEKTVKTNVVSIQERLRNKVNMMFGELDDVIDEFIDNDFEHDFNCYLWLRDKNVKAQHCPIFVEIMKPMVDELLDTRSGMDPQLVEAYSHMSTTQMDKYIDFMQGILNDVLSYETAQKAIKVPRKKKTISVDRQVAKLKYLKQFDDMKLVSIAPEQIPGALQLWLFNVKTRVLIKYDAMDRGGFKIQGTTLKNWSKSNSMGKKLRELKNNPPIAIVNRVLSGGKIILRNIFKDINTKEIQVTGRINNDMILLKAIK
tara:strand:- start:608 stop:1690 length:1083 start_codon:yes stop_codon:yes gene_type:complete